MVLHARLPSMCRIYSREATNWSPCDHLVMSVEELAKKKQIRVGHKTSAIRIIGSAEGLLTTAGSDTSSLTQLSRSLQEKLDILMILGSEIINLVDEGSVADEIEQADIFKEGIYSTMVKIEKYCASPTDLPATSRSAADPTSLPCVKLPKLTIKPFNGNLTAWTTFLGFV